MRRFRFLVFVVAAGCASAGNVVQSTPPVETVRVQGAGGGMTVATVHEASATGGAVPFAIDPAWLALRKAYDSLGIAVATVDNTNHLMGNPNIKLRRRLGDVALSKYINCGNTQGSPSADTYEILLSVLTTLRPDKAGTMVLTTVEGQGRPITLSGDYTRCSTTGVLEKRMVDLVNGALKR